MVRANEGMGIRAKSPESEQISTFDVVCGRGVKPSAAMAARVYEGETHYFCCTGCAEAFDANPRAYIGEEPIRAYQIRERMELGPDPERLRALEAEHGRYRAQIEGAEQRAGSARADVERLRRELEDARRAIAEQSKKAEAYKEREAQVSAAPDTAHIKELEQQVNTERNELAAAERALAEARRNEQAFLLKQQAEASDLGEREKILQSEIRNEEARARDLEGRIGSLDSTRREWDDVRAKLAQRRDEMETITQQEADLRARAAQPDVAGAEREISAQQAAIEETQRQLAAAEQQQQQGIPLGPEVEGGANYPERLSKARIDLEEAQQQLAEARQRVEAVQTVSPADIATLEQRRQSVATDLHALEARVTDLQGRVGEYDALRDELEKAHSLLAKRYEDLQAMGKRDEEIRAALKGEHERTANLEAQVARERDELEAAQRTLAETRMRTEEMLRQRRTEIAELRRSMPKGGTATEEARAKELEARADQLQREADEAERRAAELRDAERHSQGELDRIRREKRQVVMEGLPAAEGEFPAELYRVEHVQKGSGGPAKRG